MYLRDLVLISDDFEWNELLQDYLQGEGYSTQMLCVNEAGIATAELSARFQLAVIDCAAQDARGTGLLRAVRRYSRLPILALTAQGDRSERAQVLQIGADDCLSKTAGPAELTGRVRVLLRHSRDEESGASAVRFLGRLALWSFAQRAEWNGRLIDLSIPEFRLLGALAMAGDRPVPRQDLSQCALGRPYTAEDRDIELCISNVSAKLWQLTNGHASIRPVFRQGYQLLRG